MLNTVQMMRTQEKMEEDCGVHTQYEMTHSTVGAAGLLRLVSYLVL